MSTLSLRNGAHKGAALLVLGLALVAATGCGSNSGGSAAQSGGGAGVAEAQTLTKQATTRPTSIGLTTAIGKSVPTGKKVAFISCGVLVLPDRLDALQVPQHLVFRLRPLNLTVELQGL